MMRKSFVILLVMFSLVLLLEQKSERLALAEVEEPTEPLADPSWETIQKISPTSPLTAAIQPSLAASSSGSKLIVVYPGILNNDDDNDDIFFSRSTNYGATWPTKSLLHSSPGVTSNSLLADVAITPNNKGHAVWLEEVGDVPRLVYKYEDNWGNNSSNLVTISSLAASSGTVAGQASIVAKSNNRLDVVWVEYNFLSDSNSNIYHAYSTSSTGSSWQGKARIANTSPSSVLPDITVDSSGKYHVVWEEGTSPPTVWYAQGTPSGNNVVWSSAINISNRSITNNTTARQPKILVEGNTIHVTYTNFVSQENQFVHHLRCSSNCTVATNWVGSGNPISGQLLGAKASEPLWLVSDIGQIGSCTFVYFHGIQGPTSENERIWGVNSCDGWAASARDQVTVSGIRSIYPSLVTANNWWVYLAYEQTNTNGTIREIYFVRNRPALYLPLIRK